MAVPPVEEERASAGVLVAKVISAIALASVAGLFAVGVLPLPFSVNRTASSQRAAVDAPAPQPRQQVAEPTIPATSPIAEVAAARSPEQAALVERFVALRQQAEQPQAVRADRAAVREGRAGRDADHIAGARARPRGDRGSSTTAARRWSSRAISLLRG